jgi:hypothetical protein
VSNTSFSSTSEWDLRPHSQERDHGQIHLREAERDHETDGFVSESVYAYGIYTNDVDLELVSGDWRSSDPTKNGMKYRTLSAGELSAFMKGATKTSSVVNGKRESDREVTTIREDAQDARGEENRMVEHRVLEDGPVRTVTLWKGAAPERSGAEKGKTRGLGQNRERPLTGPKNEVDPREQMDGSIADSSAWSNDGRRLAAAGSEIEQRRENLNVRAESMGRIIST